MPTALSGQPLGEPRPIGADQTSAALAAPRNILQPSVLEKSLQKPPRVFKGMEGIAAVHGMTLITLYHSQLCFIDLGISRG